MKPTKVTIHCSATPNGRKYDISKIDAYHKSIGFKSCGYHLVIQPDGEVQRGRGLNKVGAHVKGANDYNIGICLIGMDKFSLAQFEALRGELEGIRLVYDIPLWKMFGHYEFTSAKIQAKTCPNIRIPNLLYWLLTHDETAIREFLREYQKVS